MGSGTLTLTCYRGWVYFGGGGGGGGKNLEFCNFLGVELLSTIFMGMTL